MDMQYGNMKGHVSKRALEGMAVANPMRDALFSALNYIYDPVHPAINMGTAQNDLMQKELVDKINASLEFQVSDLSYGEPQGSQRLRQIMGSLLTRHLKPVIPVDADHVFVATGAGAAIYYLASALTDPGDSIMVVSPYYGSFDGDVCMGSQIDLIPLYLNNSGNDWDLSVDLDSLEETWEQAEARNKKVKALIITNPHNPLGRCFSQESIETLLRYASKHNLHVISDEVYALSTFGHLLPDSNVDQDPFLSVLSLPNLKQLIDPSLVHVVYGLSKDFGVNGLRVGFVIDQHNPILRNVLPGFIVFSYTSTLTDRLLCNMFSDEAWIDNFIETNRQRLVDAYTRASHTLKRIGVDHVYADAGQFMVVDLRAAMIQLNGRPPTFDDEKKLMATLLQHGVYMVPGHAFYIREPGFFRITFTVDKDRLKKGIDILTQTLSIQ